MTRFRDVLREHRRALPRAPFGRSGRGASWSGTVYVWLTMTGRAARQRARVLVQLQRTPGRTINELAVDLKLPSSSVVPRLHELEREGIVRRGPVRRSTVTGVTNETWWPVRQRLIPLVEGKRVKPPLQATIESFGGRQR